MIIIMSHCNSLQKLQSFCFASAKASFDPAVTYLFVDPFLDGLKIFPSNHSLNWKLSNRLGSFTWSNAVFML